MQLQNNNPLDLSGAPGEVITVSVNAQNTASIVAMTLNGAPFSGPTFPLGAAGSVATLTVTVSFSGGGSGRYAITLTGSGGGDTSFFVVHEPSVVKVNSVTYTINS
jgi:phage tail sheath gpL-like